MMLSDILFVRPVHSWCHSRLRRGERTDGREREEEEWQHAFQHRHQLFLLTRKHLRDRGGGGWELRADGKRRERGCLDRETLLLSLSSPPFPAVAADRPSSHDPLWRN